ncbi:DUF2911 domain-containing protein [Rhodohalobacter barkolensis]|uniref:DUF2911 domain-containing protein n=1 Tax=Rhodohalobacter barkolensis TaxID=2053187 RepID=A0A2N0VLU6_9BACT|nr:DUF2911 domain-containing protein [Rhodohalobacter barkolensis]PKD45177.1 hypothetical protein CWD77_06935 [Rhodohalobacter barkolensis]
MNIQSTIIAAVLGFSLIFASSANAQERGNDSPRVSPNASVSQTIGTTVVTVTYGRPGVRDREIFGDLVPYDEVWRTGANESTVITFSDNVLVEGRELNAGTYSLYTLPGLEEWNVIFNSNLSWGTEYDPTMDVLRVSVDPQEGEFMEQMMIYFDEVTEESGHMIIHWEETKIPVQIEEAN